MKLSAALKKVINGDLKRKITLMEEDLGKEGKMLAGRQIAWMVYYNYAVNKVDMQTLDFQDLISCHYKNSLKGFMHAWDKCLLGMSNHPDDDTLENLFRAQILKITLSRI